MASIGDNCRGCQSTLSCVAYQCSWRPTPGSEQFRKHLMIKLWRLTLVFALIVCAFASAPLFAQAPAGPLPNDPAVTASSSQAGIILGTVTDINDSPVPGATVSLHGSDSSDVRSVTTNESGFFELREVEPGRSYQVSINAAGFAEWDSPALTLEPGQSKILDVSKLQIQEVQTLVKRDSRKLPGDRHRAGEDRGEAARPGHYPEVLRRLRSQSSAA